jgi:hypothetical protein
MQNFFQYFSKKCVFSKKSTLFAAKYKKHRAKGCVLNGEIINQLALFDPQ